MKSSIPMMIQKNGFTWYLASYLTILDRKNSYHLMIGPLWYCRPRKAR